MILLGIFIRYFDYIVSRLNTSTIKQFLSILIWLEKYDLLMEILGIFIFKDHQGSNRETISMIMIIPQIKKSYIKKVINQNIIIKIFMIINK